MVRVQQQPSQQSFYAQSQQQQPLQRFGAAICVREVRVAQNVDLLFREPLQLKLSINCPFSSDIVQKHTVSFDPDQCQLVSLTLGLNDYSKTVQLLSRDDLNQLFQNRTLHSV